MRILTVHHYIASNREIPTGDFGQNPMQIENMIIYETEDDFFGISVWDLEGYDEIREKFSNPFVYHLDCRNTRKCYSDLFRYINENLSDGESIELYTCLDGDELKEKNDILHVVVNLKTKHFINDIGNFMLNEKRLFDELSERFSFRERQYVVVTK